MADITLKAYLAHLDDLLSRRLYEEAEAHCTHILAKFPKNLYTLRRLAKAQFEAGRYPEAEKTYAAVLSMDPRSVEAYVGLSWVARQRGQGDQAIALLERAYEQDTNNQDVVQLLHDAHRTFHDRNNAKLPQTQFIAARQQWRSGLGQQAVATLNAALAHDPARTDIRLLKMQIHQQAGEGVEAARAATDALKQLPDCVEANAMLAQFWKAQGRPSDAQRFVAHVEAADPFLAFEIATGAPPPDEALSLSLFNYRAASSPSASTETPDWLGELGKNEPTQLTTPVVGEQDAGTLDWLSSATATEDKADDIGWLKDAVDSSAMPEDLSWLNEAAAETNNAAEDDFDFEAEFSLTDDAAPMPDMNIDWMDDAEAVDEGDTLDSVSTRIANDDAKHHEVLSELAALSDDGGANVSGHSDVPAEDDWMAALNSVSDDATTPDREDFDDFLKNFTSFSEISAEAEVQSSGTGLTGLLGGLETADDNAPVSPDVADIDPEDPLAWMRAGVGDDNMNATTDAAEMPDLDALLSDDLFGVETPAPQASLLDTADEQDPFAWMKDHDVEMVDDAPAESLWDDPLGVQELTSIDQAQADPMQWLRDEGVDFVEEADDEADPLAWAKESGVDLLDDVGTANITQTASVDLEWAAQAAQADSVPSNEADEPDSSDKAQNTGLLSYIRADGPAHQGADSMSDQQQPDWFTDDENKQPNAEQGDLADFDWMAVTPADAADDIDWDAAPDVETADEAAPDWLASLENPVDATEVAALSAKDDPSIPDLWDDAADDAAAQPEWMAALRDESAENDAPITAADWVFSEGEPSKDEIIAEDILATGATTADEALDWLNDPTPGEAVPAPAAIDAAGDAISWSAAVTPDENDAESEAETGADWLDAIAPVPVSDTDTGDWLDAPVDPNALPVAEADDDDTLDWLQAVAPAAEVESTSERSLDAWLSDAEAELSPSLDEAAAAVEAEAQDWLSAAAPDEEPVAGDDDGGLDWLSTAVEDAPVAAAAATSMDWLDLEDDGLGDETNAFIAQDSLDWLTTPSEEGDAAEHEVAPAEAAASYELSFIEEDEATGDVQTVELEGDPLPDWLVEVRSDTAGKIDVDVPEEQLNIQHELSGEILDDADLLEADQPVQETLNASAVNSPDWLNAMVPGLDVGGDLPDDDEPAVESEFLNGGRSDFGWLSNIVAEELAPPAMPAPGRRSTRFPFSEPPTWLALLREETRAASPVMDFDSEDDSLPDWLKFDDAETK